MQQNRTVLPGIAVAWTVGLFAVLVSATSWRTILTCSAWACVASCGLVRSFSMSRLIGWVLVPVAAPLIFIHGVLNPLYHVDLLLGGWLPIRSEGIVFGARMAGRLALLAAALVVWRFTDKRNVLYFFHRLGVPTFALCLFAVAASSIRLISIRAQAVKLAQEARGVDWRRNIVTRFHALPRFLFPIVVATLVEAGNRGALMEHRGFGRAPLALPIRWSRTRHPQWSEVITSLSTPGVAFLLWLMR